MAKFRFRLETLQKLRENHRDEMRSKLSEALHAEQLLKERTQAIHLEETELQRSLRDTLQARETNVNQLLSVQRYSAVLRSQHSTIKQQSHVLAGEIEKRRLALVEADREVRVLEKLRERQLSVHQQQAGRAESKIMDEIASRAQEVDH